MSERRQKRFARAMIGVGSVLVVSLSVVGTTMAAHKFAQYIGLGGDVAGPVAALVGLCAFAAAMVQALDIKW